MTRKYEGIWHKIRDNLDPDTWVVVTTSNREMVQTVINMVMIEKSRANITRKRLDLPSYGKLEIRRDFPNLRVSFRLIDAGAQL